MIFSGAILNRFQEVTCFEKPLEITPMTKMKRAFQRVFRVKKSTPETDLKSESIEKTVIEQKEMDEEASTSNEPESSKQNKPNQLSATMTAMEKQAVDKYLLDRLHKVCLYRQ